MLGLFFWHARDTMPMLAKSWPLMLMPTLGLLSIFWSPYPADATRSGILLFLTPILLITIACRVRAPELLRVMMLGGALAALYCIPYWGTLPMGGPYAQKNILAYQMMVVALISLAVSLRSKEASMLRLIALASMALAFTLQLIADSATSLILFILGSVVLIGVKIVWDNAAKVAHLRTVVFSTIIVLALTVTLGILMMPQNTMLDDFLGLVGKDSTLTGRTDIWIGAAQAAAENPWFGVGLEGFWQPNTGLAQTLNELTHSDPGSSISFHSAFWEARVHLGLVGLGCFIFAMLWAGQRTIRLWLQDGGIVNSTLLLFYLIVFTSCFTESYAMGSFSPMVALVYFGALAKYGVGDRQFVGTAHLVEQVA
jgi:exopolysaccharide production protein ExoQ